MAEYSGYVVVLDEEQRSDLLRMASTGEKPWRQNFSDALSSPDWEIGDNEVCIISFGGKTFDLASLGKRGKRIVTAKYRVEFSMFTDLSSIPIAEIEKRLSSSIRQYFTRSVSGRGRRVPPTTWKGIITELKALRPNASEALDHLHALRLASKQTFRGSNAETVALERDAVGVAQDIFDQTGELRKKTLARWVPPEDALPPFLAGADGIVLSEEQMLAIDANVFPGGAGKAARFGRRFVVGNRVLDVSYLNRTALERTLGVDLFYYNHDFDSYTVVQYKRMTKERITEGRPESYAFRPSNDDSFRKELNRMRRFRNQVKDAWSSSRTPVAYRLCGDGFFFKFCPALQLEVLNSDLIQGMYIPREYLESLLESIETSGPRGGKLISFDNVSRYMNNTEFTALVKEGWIGTRGVTTEQITKLVKAAFSGRRAVVLARSASS
jgi:hypothetical protein